MLKGLDDIGSILEYGNALSAFERDKNTIPAPKITGAVDVKISQPQS